MPDQVVIMTYSGGYASERSKGPHGHPHFCDAREERLSHAALGEAEASNECIANRRAVEPVRPYST